jgi:hypothetical protein
MATRTKAPDADLEVALPEGEPIALGDAAQSALQDVLEHGGTQDVLEDTDYTKVRFVGMSFDSLDHGIKIGDEKTFIVRARCVGTADEASKQDGHVRHIVKMDVQSVVVQD